MTWVDSSIVAGHPDNALAAKLEILHLFDCEESDGMTKYNGCKLGQDADLVQLT